MLPEAEDPPARRLQAGSDGTITVAEGLAGPFTPFEIGREWGRAWDTTWFRVTGRIPASFAGRRVSRSPRGCAGWGFSAGESGEKIRLPRETTKQEMSI